MRPLGLLLAALLTLPLVLAAPAAGEEEGARLIVGYEPGQDTAARATIQLAGGEVARSNSDLGVAVVETDNPDQFRRVASASPSIQYVETDDPIRLSGAQWNGAQWNGAQWNGAQWNGAQWNGAQWNGAQWNGAQWNAAVWTSQAFRADGGTRWQYDLATTDPGLAWQWGSWRIHAPDAWQAATGARDATLCVLDSGVAWDHPDLAPNAWTSPAGEHGYNARDPAASPYDDAGHGTHVAGIAAAAIGNAFGVAGVGNVRVQAVKVLGADGTGYESDLAFGLAWCGNQGSDVAVMALSATEPGPTLDRALAYASARDVLLLASAGNDGPCEGCVAFPASDPRVVAVSAVDGNLTRAPFSNAGPEVELAAPGVHVLSTFLDDAFVFGSGTSQAVAHAAGAAALLRDAHPDWTAAQTRAALASTALDLGPEGADPAYGAGLVDVAAAMGAAPRTSA